MEEVREERLGYYMVYIESRYSGQGYIDQYQRMGDRDMMGEYDFTAGSTPVYLQLVIL